MYVIQFIRGFCMALADSVPGVSGGTVAFLLGFYDEFIGSIDDLISGNMEKKKKALFFLIKLGIGWVPPAPGKPRRVEALSKPLRRGQRDLRCGLF